MTWVLVIVGYLAITGYHSEADCQAAAKVLWTATTHCVPAAPDARVSTTKD
jgi:hypothetical protein